MPNANMVHAIGEVYLGERWVQMHTYAADKMQEVKVARLLVQQGLVAGYGIHLDGAPEWDALRDAYGQSALSGPSSLPLQDWRVAYDSEQFYAAATDPSLKMGWTMRVKWMLAAGLVNRQTRQVRMQNVKKAA